MKNSNVTSYAGWITRGPQIKVGDKTYQKKVGAVVVTIEGTKLKVGWSLCNYKEGDRFNPEQAMSLAEGRARLQHTNSLKFSKNQVPTTKDMIRKGVPQSCLATMSQLVSEAISQNKEIRQVVVFNTKTERAESAPQLMW